MSVNGNEVKIKVPAKPKESKNYDWDELLQNSDFNPAPKECFNQNFEPPVNEFEVKHKLEITSPDNSDFAHLATVINFIGPRLQLRLEGCDNSNDVFELVDSENIYPIGAGQTKKYFAAPLRFRKDAASYNAFCKQILRTASIAPVNAFKNSPKPPPKNLFKVGMKLEAVDIKHPSNICPASIKEIDHNQIEIHLDGWDSNNDYKCSYLSRNLFPVGWCKATGHPLQQPGPKVESKLNLNKKELNHNNNNTNNSTATSNNGSIKISNYENNDAVKAIQNKQVITHLKSSISNTSNADLPPTQISNTNNTLNTNNLTTPNINNVSKTSTNSTSISSVSNQTNLTPKSTNNPSISLKAAKVKNELTTDYVSTSVVLNNLNSNNRGIKRQHEKVEKPVVNEVTCKVPLQATSQLKHHLKFPLPMSNTVYTSPSQQPKKMLPKLGIQSKPAPKAKTTIIPKMVFQTKPPMQQVRPQTIVSQHLRPVIQHFSAQHSSKLNNISHLKSTIQTKTANAVSNNVSVTNGNNTSFVSKYVPSIPNSKIVNDWSIEDVVDFLKLRLPEFSKYETEFRSNEIDGKAFLLLTNESMMKFMNIKLGYSLKICNIIEKIIASDS